jgi:ATP-dependent helicase/DNAse subunit B
MAKDKYSAVWVSHSRIADWLACPRAYYLKHEHRDPKSGNKITLMSPPLALGQAVHEVIESLSVLPVEKRFEKSLIEKLEEAWQKIQGKKGGFADKATEARYKEKAKKMLRRVGKKPGPLKRKALKIGMDPLPHYWLSEEDNIILCGKVDWLEYLADKNKIHIIDFKTGKKKEADDSLQLAIYHLLVSNCQKRKVDKASYWYIERADEPTEQKIKDLKKAEKKILKLAKEIKLAKQLDRFKCKHGGCRRCDPWEAVVKGEAELVGIDSRGNDLYILSQDEAKQKSEIL